MTRFHQCPRCGDESYERLATYSHCSQCFYFEDYWRDVETDYLKAMKEAEEANRWLKEHNLEETETETEGNNCEETSFDEKKGA